MRYLHTRGSPTKDVFHFTATVTDESGSDSSGASFSSKVN